ncbi:MAG: methyl-accepting chemotaxis protein [Ancalomicrobiaceae bacterium]|nr:methyl-accepting chemotaxis protein [Ancalomicrobiaceae bacterium]
MAKSISTRLSLVFAVMMAAGLALGAIALWQESEIGKLEAMNTRNLRGAIAIERVNGLIYAVVMDSRGIYMSPDTATAKKFASGLLKSLDGMEKTVSEWDADLPPDLRSTFDQFKVRAAQFRDFRRETVRLGTEVGPPEARKQGDNDANRTVRSQLNKDLEALGARLRDESLAIGAANERAALIGKYLTIATLIVLIGCVAFGMMFAQRRIGGPIRDLVACIQRIARGETALSVPSRDRNDEIGALAAAVEHYRTSVAAATEAGAASEQSMREREVRQARILSLVSTFDRDMQTSLRAVEQVTSSVSEAAKSQIERSALGAEQTRQVALASERTTSNVQTVSSAAEQLSASIAEINRNVDDAARTATRAVTYTDESAAAVGSLSASAERIGAVVGLIQSIAAQTNLLALNATIESARAGEAGRGFAVVANEVKNLAGQTAKATEEIAAQISAMQAATRTTVSAIETIGTTIREIDRITVSVASAVEEQGASTNEIARNVSEAAKGTVEVNSYISEIDAVVNNTSEMSQGLLDEADRLETVIRALNGTVGHFLSEIAAA